MTIISNCLAHNSPHEAHGQCFEYRRQSDAHYESQRVLGLHSFDDGYEYFHGDVCSWADDRWPEPHEGIIGTLRDEDDLLDLTEPAIARRAVFAVIARSFQEATLVGNPAPVVRRLYERFVRYDAPLQPGDLVIESSALYRPDRLRTAFGIYLTKRVEWAHTKEELAEAIEKTRTEESKYYKDDPTWEWNLAEYFDPRNTDEVVYVQYGSNPEAVCRWTNCSFVALPTTMAALDALRGPGPVRDEQGRTVLTRDNLLGSLSDSGFALDLSS